MLASLCSLPGASDSKLIFKVALIVGWGQRRRLFSATTKGQRKNRKFKRSHC